MASCRHCQDAGTLFDRKKAESQLRAYRKNGFHENSTRLLVEGLRSLDLEGRSLLDVGGGIGSIGLELLEEGLSRATLIEASDPYLEVAEAEARRRGYGDRTAFRKGDAVDLASELKEADLVTLDSVICCYPDLEELVRATAGKAERWYGVVYPKERWYNRPIVSAGNLYAWFRDLDFRMYLHEGVDETIRAQGLEPFYEVTTWFWNVALYERPAAFA